MRKFNSFLKLLVTGICLIPPMSHAEIVLHGTRVIYPSDAREVTLQISNDGTRPALVQAWVDDGNPESTPDQVKLPFMITPPITRVDPTKGQTLRISTLPSIQKVKQNQETMYWLNVLDIPPKTHKEKNETPENALQLAIRSRVKLIYRPSALQEQAVHAPKKLEWTKQGALLHVKNPTPFYVTITSVFTEKLRQKTDITPKGLMLEPFSQQDIPVTPSDTRQFSFITINDYGGRVEHPITLK